MSKPARSAGAWALITGASDGIGDALRIDGCHDPLEALQLAYNILQATGNRVTRAEFISCPTCGRTRYDIQSVIARVKAATAHLKDVKIGIMGCVVNGPGEMADADFGCVGGAPGKINLYVGKTPVQYNIPEDQAADRLVQLIKDHNRWTDPPASPSPAKD